MAGAMPQNKEHYIAQSKLTVETARPLLTLPGRVLHAVRALQGAGLLRPWFGLVTPLKVAE